MPKFAILCACMMVHFLVSSQELYINELVSNNDGSFTDEDGDASDWIEIYNNSDEIINLNGYGISDDMDDPFKWTFPEVSLFPLEYLVVYCSDKNRFTEPLHTNFRISSSGENILLTNPEGVTIDYISPTPLAEGFALARICFEECYWEVMDANTPGQENGDASMITFSKPSGLHEDELEIVLFHSLGHDIRYTLDGSTPTAESELVEGPLVLSDATDGDVLFSSINTSPYWSTPTGDVLEINTIRARSFIDVLPTSKVFSKTYPIGEEASELFNQYPIISLQIDGDSLFHPEYGIHVPGVNFSSSNSQWTGNYFMRGREWEREAHIEYFENGQAQWSQSVGVRIHGGKTRNRPQKSLRLYARNHLGAGEFNYPFFETKDKKVFDKLLLRSVFGCWNETVIKDELTAYVARNLDLESMHARTCAVFINGEYWGLFGIRDYFDSQFIEEEFGIPADTVDILNHASGIRPNYPADWGVIEGDNLHYVALMDFMENADMTLEENYDYISTQMDMSSMIDNYCTQIYFAQRDWPAGNHKVWRGGGDTKWRWLLFDLDSGWGTQGPANYAIERITQENSTHYSNPSHSTFLLRKLLESPQFVNEFLERYACLMKNEFQADTLQIAIDRFEDIYTPGMPRTIDRWHHTASMASWTSRINSKLRDFADLRQEYTIQNFSNYFDIDYNINDYDCEAIVTSSSDQAEETIHMAVYPNPAANMIWVDVESTLGSQRAASLRVFDGIGRIVMSSEYEFHQQIDISSLSAGVYVVVVEDEGIRATRKFVKE